MPPHTRARGGNHALPDPNALSELARRYYLGAEQRGEHDEFGARRSPVGEGADGVEAGTACVAEVGGERVSALEYAFGGVAARHRVAFSGEHDRGARDEPEQTIEVWFT
jgi:hypothetical protein